MNQGEGGSSSLGVRVLTGLRRVVGTTFVDPFHEGRPQPRGWPRGLVAVGAGTLVLLVLLYLAAVLAEPLRSGLELSTSTVTRRTVPTATLPLLLVSLVWSLALLHAAAIRLVWYLKTLLLLVLASAVALQAASAFDRPALQALSVVTYAVVVLFVVVRGLRPYAWWELPVIATLLAVMVLAPLAAPGFPEQSGLDTRLAVVEGSYNSIAPLAFPALMVAGAAPAMVTVTAASAISSRRWPRAALIGLTVVVVVWRLGTSVNAIVSDPVESGPGSLLTAVVVWAAALVAVTAVMWPTRRQRTVEPGALSESWSGWLLPLAVGLWGFALLLTPLLVTRGLAGLFGLTWLEAGTNAVHQAFRVFNAPGNLRGAMTLVGAGLAVWLARRGRRTEAVLVASFAGLACYTFLITRPRTPILPPRTVEALTSVSAWVAVVVLVVLLLTRRLTERRLGGVLLALLAGGLYGIRDALDDPVSAVLGFAGLGAVLFGLVWQTLTGAAATRHGSRRLPQSTRVLAYLANSMLAVSSVAVSSLSREPIGTATPADLQSLGDDVLGTPLLLVAVLLGLWQAVRPERREPYRPPALQSPEAVAPGRGAAGWPPPVGQPAGAPQPPVYGGGGAGAPPPGGAGPGAWSGAGPGPGGLGPYGPGPRLPDSRPGPGAWEH